MQHYALDELPHIVNNKHSWYDYTPFFAKKILEEFENALGESSPD
jgi:ABC-type Zn uptake system ZnuABC Zn-binding protein ZnuA